MQVTIHYTSSAIYVAYTKRKLLKKNIPVLVRIKNGGHNKCEYPNIFGYVDDKHRLTYDEKERILYDDKEVIDALFKQEKIIKEPRIGYSIVRRESRRKVLLSNPITAIEQKKIKDLQGLIDQLVKVG